MKLPKYLVPNGIVKKVRKVENNMEFFLSKEQFKELLNICKTNKKEVSGKMYFTQKGDKYSFKYYKMDEKETIASADNSSIKFKLQELLQDLVFETYDSDGEIYVVFHTHPGFLSAAGLSDEDRNFLKYLQEMANQVTRRDGNKVSIQVVSGVICRDKMGFYYYDTNLGQFKRIRTYVNGIEVIPDLEADGSKTKTQSVWKRIKKIEEEEK